MGTGGVRIRNRGLEWWGVGGSRVGIGYESYEWGVGSGQRRWRVHGSECGKWRWRVGEEGGEWRG